VKASKSIVVASLTVLALFATACSEGTDEAPDGAADTPTTGGEFDVDAALAADLDACEPAPSGDPLIIGYAADLSEVGAFADKPGTDAAAHFIDLINCSGGVDGTPVELVVEDVQGDPEVAKRATTDLLDAGAHVILGPPFADTGTPILQMVNASRAVLFVSSTEPALPDPSIFSFLTTFDDTRQAEAAAQFAFDQGSTRAITFSAEGPYFGYNPETFAAKFEELGGEVVLDQSYVPFEQVDFAPQANEVAGVADGSEVLYAAMVAPQLDALRAAIQERGVELTYLEADAFGTSGAADIKNNEGVYWTGHGFAEPGNRFQALLDSLDAAGTPSDAPEFSALAADAITVAAQGYLAAGSTDPVAIAEAIAGLSDVEAITGTIGYAGTGGVPDKPVSILQMIDDEVTLVELQE
jgi:branched-chain amino acid transport system substrate-binding protein